MMHIVMPNQLGGPNICCKRIMDSNLKKKYNFYPLNQTILANGKISIKLIKELVAQIKKIKPDIVHVSGLQSAGFHCVLAAKIAGIKNIVVTIHGFNGDSENISICKRIIFNKFVEPITLRLAKKIQIISVNYCKNRKMLKKISEKKLIQIYNMIPNSTEKKNNFRKVLNISKNDIVILLASRLVYDKGYSDLIDAIKIINNSHLKFIIIGDGPYKNIIKNKLCEEIRNRQVFLVGAQDNVMEWMNDANIFILPSLHENYPTVLLEAAVSRLPVIATEVGGIPEIIENGINGILIPKCNPLALAKAIDQLSNNKDLCYLYGKNNYIATKTRLSNKIIEEKLDKLYEELLNEN